MKAQTVRSLLAVVLVWVVCILLFVVIMRWGPGDLMHKIRLVMLSAILLGVIVSVGSLLRKRPKPVPLDAATHAKLDELAAASNRRRQTVVADLILEAWEAKQVSEEKPEAEPQPPAPAEAEPESDDAPQAEAAGDDANS